MGRAEATTERVAPTSVRIMGHGVDDGLQVLLLLQTGRVCLGGAWKERREERTSEERRARGGHEETRPGGTCSRSIL